MSDLIAYDSTTPIRIPSEAEAIFPYADGDFTWPADQLHRLRRARRRHITVLGNAAIADIGDVERFDMTPEDGPGFADDWAESHPGSRWPACLYVNRANLAELQHYMRARRYLVILATLDGSRPTRIKGGGTLVAVQDIAGDGFDQSVVYDPAWLLKGAA